MFLKQHTENSSEQKVNQELSTEQVLTMQSCLEYNQDIHLQYFSNQRNAEKNFLQTFGKFNYLNTEKEEFIIQ